MWVLKAVADVKWTLGQSQLKCDNWKMTGSLFNRWWLRVGAPGKKLSGGQVGKKLPLARGCWQEKKSSVGTPRQGITFFPRGASFRLANSFQNVQIPRQNEPIPRHGKEKSHYNSLLGVVGETYEIYSLPRGKLARKKSFFSLSSLVLPKVTNVVPKWWHASRTLKYFLKPPLIKEVCLVPSEFQRHQVVSHLVNDEGPALGAVRRRQDLQTLWKKPTMHSKQRRERTWTQLAIDQVTSANTFTNPTASIMTLPGQIFGTLAVQTQASKANMRFHYQPQRR